MGARVHRQGRQPELIDGNYYGKHAVDTPRTTGTARAADVGRRPIGSVGPSRLGP